MGQYHKSFLTGNKRSSVDLGIGGTVIRRSRQKLGRTAPAGRKGLRLAEEPLRLTRSDAVAGFDQRRHRGEFVRRVHRGAHRVFHQRGFERRPRLLDKARHVVISRDDALGGEFLQRLEPPAASRDWIEAGSLGREADDEVLL